MWWKKIETHITSSEKKIAGKKPGAIYGIGGHAESCYRAFKCDVLRVFENCTHYNAKFAFYVEYARRQRVKFESRVRLQTSFFSFCLSLSLCVSFSLVLSLSLSPFFIVLSRSLSLSLTLSWYLFLHYATVASFHTYNHHTFFFSSTSSFPYFSFFA